VKENVPAPTAEETEEFYQARKAGFVRQVPSDPNDPNSPKTQETIPYAEVAQLIADDLMNKRIYAQIDEILQEAILMAEINIHGEGLDPKELTTEQLKEYVVEYEKVGPRIGESRGIKVYAGKTGMLGPGNLNTDKYLTTMTVDGHGYYPVALAQVVFAVDELKASELGPFDAPQPKMFENIGPVKDPWAARFSDLDDPLRQIAALVRVVKAEKSRIPESIDESYETHSFVFDPNEDKSDEQVYSVRKKVAEDLKKLKAMEAAKAKAVEFIQMAKAESWETAVDKFNEMYPAEATEEDEDPNTFSVQTISRARRSTPGRMRAIAAMNKGFPNARLVMLATKLENMFTEQLYSLVPPESSSVSEPNEPVEFKPATSYFCVKDVSVNRVWSEGFGMTKPLEANRLDKIQSQSLSVVHFDPKNIEKRLGLRWVKETDAADANTSDANAADENVAGADDSGQAEDQ
jgi:hypothetical protein